MAPSFPITLNKRLEELRWLNNILIHHCVIIQRVDTGVGGYCIVGGEKRGFGGLVWNSGGESTYSRRVRVVLPVIATAKALAPTSPILFPLRLKREWGKGKKQVEHYINEFA